NSNQQLDRHEKGLKGVPVSNGRDIVYTDSKGRFELHAQQGMSIFPILQTGFQLSGHESENILNANFHYLDPSKSKENEEISLQFGLKREEQSPKFSFGAIGDI